MTEGAQADHLFDAVDEPEGPPLSRRRAVVAWVVVATALGVLGAVVARGEWADDKPRDPADASQGSICQLVALDGGGKQIRCARVIDAPAADVWGVVTDYAHFCEIFPYISSAKATKEAENLYLFEGNGGSHVGTWEWAVHVRHTISPTGSSATWDQPDGRFKVNRGGWTVTPLGPSKTLLVYAIELEITPYPAFILRNALLSRLPEIVGAVDGRLHPAKR